MKQKRFKKGRIILDSVHRLRHAIFEISENAYQENDYAFCDKPTEDLKNNNIQNSAIRCRSLAERIPFPQYLGKNKNI